MQLSQQAKIENDHSAFIRDQNIGRLEVTMKALGVQKMNSFRELEQYGPHDFNVAWFISRS